MPPKLAHNRSKGGVSHHLPPETMAEKERLLKMLKKTNGNQSEVARLLGVSRVTVWKRIKKYGIRLNEDLRGT